MAGFTEIHTALGDVGASSEYTHAQILSGLYGGSFVSSGVDFSNGSITATRIHDFDNGDGQSGAISLLSTSTDGMNDQVWIDGISEIGVRTRYASQSGIDFGYYQSGDDPSTGFTGDALISIGGDPMLGLGGTYGPTDISGAWRWGIDADGRLSSSIGENADGADHLVTYLISGEGLTNLGYDADTTVWLLFWDSATDADGDFNDYVVELSAAAVAVPLPAPLLMAGVGLIGLILGRRHLSRQLS